MASNVNCVWRNGLGNNRTSADHTTFANCDTFQNNSPLSNPYVVIDPNILIVLRELVFFFDINDIPANDIKSMIPAPDNYSWSHHDMAANMNS